MTVAVAERAPGQGVIEADVDLRSVVDAIARATDRHRGLRVRRRRRRHGHRPSQNSNLVLARHQLRRRSRRCAPRWRGRAGSRGRGDHGRDPDGMEVLSAFQRVDPPGWWVFVEEPLSEAFAPIESAIWRTALLLVVFLLVAIATSVLLARNLVEADRVDPGRRGEDRLGCTRSADRDLQPRRARRPRRGIQPDGRTAAGVVCRARAAGRGADSGADRAHWPGWTSRPASWRRRATTSRSSSPTCRTSCGLR